MEDELHHPLRPLRERLRRVEVVEAGEVDEREGDEEAERDGRRAREASVAVLEAVPHEEDEEDRRQDVRERERAGELPLQLVERDGEDRQRGRARRARAARGRARAAGSRERERVARHASSSMSAAISSTRARRESRSSSRLRELDRREPAVREPRVQLDERGSDPVDVVGRDDDAGARLADQVGRGAVGRDDGEDRASGRDVLEHLPGEDALAAPACIRARAGAAPRSRAGAGATRRAGGSRRARADRRARATRPTRGPTSGSRRRSGRRRRGPASWNACRNGRGSRFPKKLPVCVMRKRGAGRYSSPAKSSKSQPFAIMRTAPRAPSPRTSSAIASETHVTASASPRDEPRDLLVRGLARARRGGVVAAVLVRDERIAQVGDPASAGRPLDGRADEVDRARRRRRDHDVDALPPRDPDRGRDRGEVPRHARVGDEQATCRDLRLDERALEPVRGAELLRRLARPRADVARAVDPCLRRDAQLGIAVHPLRVVGCEHVRLDAERGKVLRELERALDAASARRREVHRHEQHLHGREG